MPNLINQIVVRQLTDEFTNAEGMVIVSLNGLSVQETENLRNALAAEGVRLRMVRNRLATLALKSRGFEAGRELFGGNVACAWGSTEETIRIAKVVAKAVSANDPRKAPKVSFRGGLFEGSLLDAKGAAALADMPGKDELRAMMLGLLSGPARALAILIQGPGASLARVIQAHADKAPAESGAGAPEAS